MHNNIIISSCNIWFSDHDKKIRTEILCNTIVKNNIDIMCMQEVTTEPYEKIKKTLKYCYPDKITNAYGCAIISKYPIVQAKTIGMQSNMGRSLLIAKININGKIVIVCTTHFESEFNKNNKNKLLQYEYVSAILNKIHNDYKNVIFCADTNIIKDDKFAFNEEFRGMNDCWKEAGLNKTKKYTYDFRTNKYMRMQNYKFLARLDRILFKCDDIKCKDFDLITEEFSDHYGIIGKFITT